MVCQGPGARAYFVHFQDDFREWMLCFYACVCVCISCRIDIRVVLGQC